MLQHWNKQFHMGYIQINQNLSYSTIRIETTYNYHYIDKFGSGDSNSRMSPLTKHPKLIRCRTAQQSLETISEIFFTTNYDISPNQRFNSYSARF